MSNYSKTTNFAAKDALASGNPLKTIKGTEFNVEFDALQVASATKANIAAPTFTGVPAAPTANAGTNTTQIATTAFVAAAGAAAMPKSGGAFTGAVTTNSTFDGRDVAADGILATNAMPKSGGAFSGAVTTNSTIDGRDVAADGVLATNAMPKSGGAFSGALTTNSTFDGRNVSTDGSKLDGVATNANNFSYPSQSGKTGQFLKTNGSAALWDAVPAGGAEEFVASGALPNGKPVILKANGQIEVVKFTATPVSQSIPAASNVAFDTGNSDTISVSFDPNTANKFVIAYKDGNDSNKGKVVVGSISGTTLSFGSANLFAAGSISFISVAFDPNTANKFVVVFKDGGNSNYGRSIVGTVSGNSISYGSTVNFNASVTNECKISFDPKTAGKFVVSFSDSSNSSRGVAIAGNVSGTSLNYGTAVIFNSSSSTRNSLAFDPNTAGKFVITFRNGGNSNRGTAIVGTMSGMNLSFGSLVVFDTTGVELHGLAFDPNAAGIFVIAYRDYGNSNYGTGIVGTVSGTNVSFASKHVFNSSQTNHFGLSFDPNTVNKFVVAFSDDDLDGKIVIGTRSNTSLSYSSEIAVASGEAYYFKTAFDPNSSGKFVTAFLDGTGGGSKAFLGQIASSINVTNLTSTNFLGTATAAYTNGQTASIMLQGGISENQSSLAIGSTYFVQPNGTFATSAGTPSVLAGKAVSATSLLLNGLDEIPSQSGNTGKFLTTDGSAASWGTVPAAGMTLLSTITANNSSTIDIETTFDGTYDSYVIMATNARPAGNGAQFQLRMKLGGSYPESAYNYHINFSGSDSTSYQSQKNDNHEYVLVTHDVGNGVRGSAFNIFISDPTNASSRKSVHWQGYAAGTNSAGSIYFAQGVGLNTGSNAALTGIRLFLNSGNILSGKFRLYGIAK